MVDVLPELEKRKSQDTLSRRGFVKTTASIVAAAGVTGLAVAIGEREGKERWNIKYEEAYGRFVGEGEAFPGKIAYYNGAVIIQKGATIYSEPRIFKESEKSGIITTNIRPETSVGTVSTEDERFEVYHPLLVLREATSQSRNTLDIKPESGETKTIDLDSSWVIFGFEEVPDKLKSDIKRQSYRVGCVQLSGGNVAYQEGATGSTTMKLDPKYIEIDERSSIGGEE